MDPFASDPHITIALFCIGIALLVAVIVHADVVADYYDEI
jgi:hypothetical protein